MSRSFGKSELLAVIRQRLKDAPPRLKDAPPLSPPKEPPRTVRTEPKLANEPRRIGEPAPAPKPICTPSEKPPFPATTHRINDSSLWLIFSRKPERREAWL
jgi:hypothetical protein